MYALRFLEFLPDRKTVQVRTYSPVTGGKNPRDPALEELRFELRAATRTEPRSRGDLADLRNHDGGERDFLSGHFRHDHRATTCWQAEPD